MEVDTLQNIGRSNFSGMENSFFFKAGSLALQEMPTRESE